MAAEADRVRGVGRASRTRDVGRGRTRHVGRARHTRHVGGRGRRTRHVGTARHTRQVGRGRRTRRVGGALLALAIPGLLSFPACRSGITKGELYLQYGFEQLALGDTTAALEYMQRARFELRDDPRVLFHIARLYAADGTIRGRARARTLLEAAIRADPRNAQYRAELGILMRRQRYVRASTKALVEAVALDSTLARAWAVLGLNLQEEYLDRIEGAALRDSAIACYERALRLDEDDVDSRYRLAFLYMHRRDYTEARELVAPYTYGRDCPVRFGLLWIAIQFRTGQFDAAQSLLDDLLDCMPWEERESWIGLKPLMHPDSMSSYTTLTDAQRDSACVGFWWARDPTPTTLANERLIEHISRAVESNTFFAVELLGREGRASDRGEVYLRYGPPSEMNRTLYGRGWEWRYPSGDPDDPTTFVFVDSYHNGDYLRVRRTALSDFSEEITFESTPEVSNIQFRQREGSWQYAMRQFRASGGRTALEIAYVVEPTPFLEAVQLDVAAWRGPNDIAVSQRTTPRGEQMYLLPDGRQIGRMRVELAPRQYVIGLQAIAIREEDVIAPPQADGRIDRGKVAWVALERDTLQLYPFALDALDMSDIMLAHDVRDGIGGLFDMGGVLAVPRVHSEVRSTALHLYFEAYPPEALLRARAALVVTYTVRPLPPTTWTFWDQFRSDFRRRMNPEQRAVVQARFTFQPREAIERQRLSIDISTLEPGPYALTVELVDPASGQSTSRSAAFEYVPPGYSAPDG